MDDLISREGAIKIILNGKVGEDDSMVECASECNSFLDAAADGIRKMPSAQKRGRWVKYKNWYACSECGNEMFFAGTYDESQHYCYNCGAKMDMERE